MIDPAQKGYYNFATRETWTPPVNLYENEYAYIVCVDLAGVAKEAIELKVHQQRLSIRGIRPVPACPDEEFTSGQPGVATRLRVHLMEIDHGAFGREVELPLDVQQERITAVYRNGLLWIELPKKA